MLAYKIFVVLINFISWDIIKSIIKSKFNFFKSQSRCDLIATACVVNIL